MLTELASLLESNGKINIEAPIYNDGLLTDCACEAFQNFKYGNT